MSKPTIHDLPPKYQAQVIAQLHATPRPKTVHVEHAPEPVVVKKKRKPSYDVARAIHHFYEKCGVHAVAEYRFHAVRKWRFDIAFPAEKLAIEVQGGIWINGGHSRGSGMVRDFAKENAAAELGWRIMKCQPKELFTEAMAESVQRATQ